MTKNPLQDYERKRNFQKTREPKGEAMKKKTDQLIFVVQEHQARSHHFDFRLELDGVLKSWAVPKGLSLNPKERRLAVQTEDHPIAYAGFQGTIPPGEYGAGEVSIWDHGIWEPASDDPVGDLKKGHMKFRLKGKRLQGNFVLLRTSWKGDETRNKWLLMKVKDEARNLKRKLVFPITSPKKRMFPEEGITKQDVADYYLEVAEIMLPYIAHRPLSFVRCPNGVTQGCFFQKHIPYPIPDSLLPVVIKEEHGEDIYVSVDSAEGIQELVQLNALEFHVWGSHADSYQYADQVVMDLDPGEEVPWKDVVDAAFEMKALLEELDLRSFVKITGGRGLHIHVPIAPLYDWGQIKSFAKGLAQELALRRPDRYVAKMTKMFRAKKIFVDYLRNTSGATAVAPYSLRARDISAVAMPLEWSELKKIKGSQEFTLVKALEKIRGRSSDPWKRMQGLGQKIVPLTEVKKTKAA